MKFCPIYRTISSCNCLSIQREGFWWTVSIVPTPLTFDPAKIIMAKNETYHKTSILNMVRFGPSVPRSCHDTVDLAIVILSKTSILIKARTCSLIILTLRVKYNSKWIVCLLRDFGNPYPRGQMNLIGNLFWPGIDDWVYFMQLWRVLSQCGAEYELKFM